MTDTGVAGQLFEGLLETIDDFERDPLAERIDDILEDGQKAVAGSRCEPITPDSTLLGRPLANHVAQLFDHLLAIQ